MVARWCDALLANREGDLSPVTNLMDQDVSDQLSRRPLYPVGDTSPGRAIVSESLPCVEN
jgi:hypothetical protein